MPGPDPCLVLADGGVAGLLACVSTASTGGGTVVFDWSTPDPTGARKEAVGRQSEVLGLGLGPESPGSAAASISAVLLDAARIAAASGCVRVIWPMSAGPGLPDGGPDPNQLAVALDRADLATRLARLDHPELAGLAIDAPYADLTDRQLADLVLDMDLPIWLCWWATGSDPLSMSQRAHWTRMLNDAGWQGQLPSPPRTPEVMTMPLPSRSGLRKQESSS